jgi:hypothetical protein
MYLLNSDHIHGWGIWFEWLSVSISPTENPNWNRPEEASGWAPPFQLLYLIPDGRQSTEGRFSTCWDWTLFVRGSCVVTMGLRYVAPLSSTDIILTDWNTRAWMVCGDATSSWSGMRAKSDSFEIMINYRTSHWQTDILLKHHSRSLYPQWSTVERRSWGK